MNGYILLTILLWPLYLAYTARIAWRDKSWRYFKQRLGYGYPLFHHRPLWLHCASVGEVNTLRPLLQLLMQQYPHHAYLITTNTVTGAQVVRKHLPGVHHCYLPVDSPGAVARFLIRFQPRLALVMETELWPLLYRQCHQRHIPLGIINGRLSPRTMNSNDWIRARYRDALAQVDHVLCRSEDDMQAFVQLGLEQTRAETLGNLKFAQNISLQVKDIAELAQRPYVLAASTHNNEEFLLAKIWKRIDHSNCLLVIAPRHPQRATSIIEQVKPLNVSVARRSNGEHIHDDTDVYLADTIGELPSLINRAELVFVGGSLVPHGGQNLLEPASLGKAIIVGPHMQNFIAETRLLVSRQACVQVQSEQELADALQTLVEDADRRHQLGERAVTVMREQAGIADHYLQKIREYYADKLVS